MEALVQLQVNKMKYYAFTSNPEGLLDGFSSSYIMRSTREDAPEGWVFVGDVEFDPDAVDMDAVRKGAVNMIDTEIEKQTANFTAGMERLRNRKESLLAIEHKPDE